MSEFIVTDLTRFSGPEKVCIAVVDTTTMQCLRPLPYIQSSKCEELNVQPGAILRGDLRLKRGVSLPHVEDAAYSNLKLVRPATSDEFKAVLDGTLSPTVSDGFGMAFEPKQKHAPIDEPSPPRSIITIKVSPGSVCIREDQFKPGKIKLSFTDNDGHRYEYLPITDRGYYDYAMAHQSDGQLFRVELSLQSQEEIYMRIGLSRAYQAPNGKNGYWMQVNGIYSFPDYPEYIRSYSS